MQARTIEPDGTIIPFTGNPIEQTLEDIPGRKVVAKVFNLSDVRIGSIIEYRYKLEYGDRVLIPPTWEVQSELFTRKEHFLWRPWTGGVTLHDKKGEQNADSIGWLPVLPKNAVFNHTSLSGTGINAGEAGQQVMDLVVSNVLPLPQEPYMPPLGSTRYRVQFYYVPGLTGEQFWKQEGKRWSALHDDFIGPGPKVAAAAQQLVGATDTDEQKLRKIYAAAAQVENLSYTRGFVASQDQAHGIDPFKSTDDLWERKSGHSDQIAALFVALARAAGMKAYIMDVAARDRTLFNLNYLSLSQLQDSIAIVKVNGVEQFFDHGEPRCPYGQLSWNHAATQGLRQTDGGIRLADTPSQSYKDSRLLRLADLKVDERGGATGTVKLTWTGARALALRQAALRSPDPKAIQRVFVAEAERQLPDGMNVEIDGIANLDEPEKPLVVSYVVRGLIGSAKDGKLSIDGTLFEANTKARFPSERRQTPIYFSCPYQNSDAVRIRFTPMLNLQAAPPSQKLLFQKTAAYSFSTEVSPSDLTTRRDLVVGSGTYPVESYPDLRTFFRQLEEKDHEHTTFNIVSTSPAGN